MPFFKQKSKSLTTYSREAVEEVSTQYTAIGNAKWYNPYGGEFVNPSQNYICICPLNNLFHL